MPIDLIISDYTLSVEMKIIEGVAILFLNHMYLKKGIKILVYVTLHCYKDIIGSMCWIIY